MRDPAKKIIVDISVLILSSTLFIVIVASLVNAPGIGVFIRKWLPFNTIFDTPIDLLTIARCFITILIAIITAIAGIAGIRIKERIKGF